MVVPQQTVTVEKLSDTLTDKLIEGMTGEPQAEVTARVAPVEVTVLKEQEIPEPTIPSQADILRGIGETLGIGRKIDKVNLDAIVHYVQTKQT